MFHSRHNSFRINWVNPSALQLCRPGKYDYETPVESISCSQASGGEFRHKTVVSASDAVHHR